MIGKGMADLIRAGVRQYLDQFPRAGAEKFGLRPHAAAQLVSIDDAAAVVELSLDTGVVMDLAAPTARVTLPFDDFDHWIQLLAACDVQHGTETTDLFFVR